MTDPMADAERKAPGWKGFAPLLLLLAGLLLFFALGGHRYLSFDTLRTHYAALRAFADERPLLAGLAFATVYATAVAVSVPSAGLLSIVGGLLFGTFAGALLAMVGATTGAVVVFLAARSSAGAALKARAGPMLDRMRDGFRANGFNYLIALRLVPLFPFWLINIAAALLGMRLGPYVLGTLLGIIPGTFVYASVGAGAGEAIAAGGEVPLKGLLLKPEILLPIAGLVLLALLPVLWKRRQRA